MVVSESIRRHEKLTALGFAAFNRGRLDRALRLVEEAEREAIRIGDRELIDFAFCNRCVVLAELDRLGSVGTDLKRVLLRATNPVTASRAAFYAAQAAEADGDLTRALSYARRARHLAETSGDAKALRTTANLLGTLALRVSSFAEARECFRQALQLGGDADPVLRGLFLDNYGYSLMCTHRTRAGYRLARSAAGVIERCGARQFLAEIYQDLCFGALQLGRPREAHDWGDRAIVLAREYDLAAVARNTLMLLADAALDAGDEARADAYLQQLAAFYPDIKGMRSFFLAFDVRDVINLRA